jgi:four helix bundle protein
MAGNAARTFEELHFYQRARELTNGVYAASRGSEFQRDRGLVDQIRRAAVSIMSNIAEGFERGTTTEFIQFLYIAKGSAGEVRAQLQIAADQQYISSEEHANLSELCRRTSIMMSNFIAHLQSSRYQGDKIVRPERQVDEAAIKRREALRAAQLANERSEAHRKRQEPNQ